MQTSRNSGPNVLPFVFQYQYTVGQGFSEKSQLSADMFEIVNEAILTHALFQGYVDSYSRLLKEAGPFFSDGRSRGYTRVGYRMTWFRRGAAFVYWSGRFRYP